MTTMKCEQLTKTGGNCRNTASFVARPWDVYRSHADRRVCGTHVNSLYLEGWKVREFHDESWTALGGYCEGGDLS